MTRPFSPFRAAVRRVGWRVVRPTPRARLAITSLEDRVTPVAFPPGPSIALTGLPTWTEQGSKAILGGSAADPQVTLPAPFNTRGSSVGAVEAVAIDPNDPAHMFAGTVNGGIWVTTNGNIGFNGADDDGLNGPDDAAEQPTWTPLTDDYPSLSIGDLKFDPSDATGMTLFAGTGSSSTLGKPGSNPATGDGGAAVGVMKTTDGGLTWATTALPGGGNVRYILPIDPGVFNIGGGQVVFAATTAGLYRSDDGGASYSLLSGTGNLPTGAVTQIVADPNLPGRFYAGVVGQGVYWTDDGGDNWVRNSPLGNPAGISAIELTAFNAGGTTVLHAFISGSSPRVFEYDASVNVWRGLATTGQINGGSGTTGQAQDQMVADPNDPTGKIVYIASAYGGNPSIAKYDPTANGNQGGWVNIMAAGASNTSPRADSRDMTIVPRADNPAKFVVIYASSGGLYYLNDPQANPVTTRWTAINGTGGVGAASTGIGATELTNVAWDATFGTVVGSSQDNGVAAQDTVGSSSWTDFVFGTGGDVQVDALNAGPGKSFRYASGQFLGSLTRYTFDSSSPTPTVPTASQAIIDPSKMLDKFQPIQITPFELNSIDPNRLVVAGVISGGNNVPVYEQSSASTISNPTNNPGWTAVSVGTGFTGVSGGFVVGGVANASANPDLIIMGSGNLVFIRQTAGGTLTPTTTPIPIPVGGTVKDIVANPTNWRNFFVTDGTTVYQTTNAGATWTNLDRVGFPGSLPSVNSNLRTLEYIPTTPNATLVVGGDKGVSRFPLNTANPTWSRYGLGLPNAPVTELRYDASGQGVLVAGTLGRGAWTIANPKATAAATAKVTVTGDQGGPAADDIQIIRDPDVPAMLNIVVNGTLEFAGPITAVQQVSVSGGAMDDVLTVDGNNGVIQLVPPAAVTGITFDGLTGNDTLFLDLSANGPTQLATTTFNGGTGTNDTIKVQVDASTLTLANASLNIGGYGSVTLSAVENADLTGGASDNTFVLTTWTTGTATLDGLGGSNTLVGRNSDSTYSITNSDQGTVTGTGVGIITFDNIGGLTGGTGNDVFQLNGGDLSGTLEGGSGAGADTVRGSTGGDTFNITGANSGNVAGKVGTFSGIEHLLGRGGTDQFSFSTGGTLSGTIDGGGGTNTLTGDGGDRTYTVTGANAGTVSTILGVGFSNVQNLTGRGGDDTFAFTTGTLGGNITGGTGIDTLKGDNTARTFVVTGPGTGTLAGLLTGTFSSTENLTGGTGNDVFTFNTGGSVGGKVDGGTGGALGTNVNTLNYSPRATAVTVNLTAGTATSTGSVANIQNIVGGAGNDSLTGNAQDNTITGGPGNDTMAGAAGADTYKFNADGPQGTDSVTDSGGVDSVDFSAGTLAVSVDLSTVLAQVVNANLTLTLSNIENAIGGAGDDTLAGGAGNNFLNGGAGNDIYRFDADFQQGTDTIAEAPAGGSDTLDFSATGLAVTVDLSKATQVVNANLTLNATNVENVLGGTGNDTLTGNAGDNLLSGGAGNDTFKFNADAASGQDTVTDVSGTDTLDFSLGTVGVAVDLSLVGVQQTVNANLKITASGVENVTGTRGDDVLGGGPGNNVLSGDLGDDTYLFNAAIVQGSDTVKDAGGIDTLDFSSSGATAVTVNLGLATAQKVNNNLTLTLPGTAALENLIGTGGDDVLTGNGLDNVITGGAGNDKMAGGGANDTFKFNADGPQGADIVSDTGGIDTLDFSAGTLAVTVDLNNTKAQAVSPNLTLTAAGMDNLVGGGGADTLTGGAGNNRLTGGPGDDSLSGGGGNDTYAFKADAPLGTDTINDPVGTDTLDFSAGATAVTVDLGAAGTQAVNGFLSVILQPGTVMDNVTGSSSNDTLSGNVGNNVLAGGPGDDRYLFNADTKQGTDSINDTVGSDTVDFSAGNQAVTVDLTKTGSQKVNANLNITVPAGSSVANVTGSGGNDTLSGNARDNILAGGLGDDVYKLNPNVAQGSDTINDTAGSDTLDLSVGTSGVTVDLTAALQQTVNANLKLTLPGATTLANVIGTSGKDVLTGNGLNNILIGRGGDDVLTGNAGLDILIGGNGLDTTDGGAGDDILVGGYTTYDNNTVNLPALLAIQKEWASATPYTTRIDHLKGTTAGGLNGTFYLRGSGSGTQTVFSDGENTKDRLVGGAEQDWFIWSLGDDVPEIPDPNVPPPPGGEIATRV